MKLSREEINVMQEALLRFSDEDIEADDFYSNEEMDRLKVVREELLKRSGVWMEDPVFNAIEAHFAKRRASRK